MVESIYITAIQCSFYWLVRDGVSCLDPSPLKYEMHIAATAGIQFSVKQLTIVTKSIEK